MRVLVDGGNSGSGGYLRYLRGMLSSGLPSDFEVLLLCSPEIAALVGELDAQVTVLPVTALSAARRSDRLRWWRRDYPELVGNFRPQVVLHPTGLVRGDSRGVPVVAVHHTMAPFNIEAYRRYGLSRQSMSFLFWRLRLKRSFQRADGVVFLAEFTRQHVGRHVKGIRRSVVVPNAVPEQFAAASWVRDYTRLGSPVQLLCVSTMWLFKYQPEVVDAVANLRKETGLDLRVAFVGGGESRARRRLAQRIQARGAAAWTEVNEAVPLDDMIDLYRSADLFVFPSADEAWPITLGEAMAAGLPIACSDRMAMPDILRDAGRYFDPADVASTEHAIADLLQDPGLRRRCGELAHQYAREFTWERSAAQLHAFLRTVATQATTLDAAA